MGEAGPRLARVHYTRLSARGTVVYAEPLVSDDARALVTQTDLAPADAARISAAFWRQGLVAEGRMLRRIRKHYYYHEWFDVLAVFDVDGGFAGYYADIVTPLVRVGTEYAATDLFLDWWLAPGQPAKPLDEDEFEAAVAAGVVTPDVAATARATFEGVRGEIAAGVFPYRYIRA